MKKSGINAAAVISAVLAAALLIIAIKFIGVIIIGSSAAFAGDAMVYRANWGINIPASKQEYSLDDTGWFGDGIKYTVFEVKTENELTDSITGKPDGTFISDFEKNFSDLGADEYYLPDWNGDVCCSMMNKNDSTLYLIYDIGKKLLYVMSSKI